jgi:hypothetical protein
MEDFCASHDSFNGGVLIRAPSSIQRCRALQKEENSNEEASIYCNSDQKPHSPSLDNRLKLTVLSSKTPEKTKQELNHFLETHKKWNKLH